MGHTIAKTVGRVKTKKRSVHMTLGSRPRFNMLKNSRSTRISKSLSSQSSPELICKHKFCNILQKEGRSNLAFSIDDKKMRIVISAICLRGLRMQFGKKPGLILNQAVWAPHYINPSIIPGLYCFHSVVSHGQYSRMSSMYIVPEPPTAAPPLLPKPIAILSTLVRLMP